MNGAVCSGLLRLVSQKDFLLQLENIQSERERLLHFVAKNRDEERKKQQEYLERMSRPIFKKGR